MGLSFEEAVPCWNFKIETQNKNQIFWSRILYIYVYIYIYIHFPKGISFFGIYSFNFWGVRVYNQSNEQLDGRFHDFICYLVPFRSQTTSPTVGPTLVEKSQMDEWPTGTPQKVSEKKSNKHPTPPTNSPGKSLKKGNIPRGWFLGWPPWRHVFTKVSLLQSWFIGRWIFFSAKNPSPADFCWSKKNLIWQTIGVTNPALKMGLLPQTQHFFFFQTQSAEAGGSKLSGVARGKDRSCGAKVSSRAWKHFGTSAPKWPEREKGKGSNWKKVHSQKPNSSTLTIGLYKEK